MELKQLYREIVNEHNLHPVHKGKMENPDLVLRGLNPSCGDDITLQLKLEGDVIKDAMYDGSGCAISQASVDMMADQIGSVIYQLLDAVKEQISSSLQIAMSRSPRTFASCSRVAFK